MKLLKLFNEQSEYALISENLENGNFLTVSYIEENDIVKYNPKNYAEEYLTFTALDDNTAFQFKWLMELDENGNILNPSSSLLSKLSYSLDNGETWTTTNINDASVIDEDYIVITTPELSTGEKILWKGDGLLYESYSGNTPSLTSISGKFNVSGNILSLIYNDDFKNRGLYELIITENEWEWSRTFDGLFKNSSIVSAKNLILPKNENVPNGCYSAMFYNCTLLTEAPELPATTLASYCYSNMFSGCTSLTTAPELPATTLADYCYQSMFSGCTSLTEAPELPATTLGNFCYAYMFQACTSLTESPELPATTLANSCYYCMFYNTNVLPNISYINFANTSIIASFGLRGLFAGTIVTYEDLCEILPLNENNKPYLPCTTLANSCYEEMFWNCSLLTKAPELPATTLIRVCYYKMFSGCTSLIEAPKLPATTLANSCYFKMFQGCTSLIKAPELPATTLAQHCYNSMFEGCTSLTEAPELPATTLASYCYYSMFKNCSNLAYIKALFTTAPSNSYTMNWVSGVASSGIFIKNSNATWTSIGTYAVPSGWTAYKELPSNFNYFKSKSLDECQFTLTIPAAITPSELYSISYSIDNGSTWTTTYNTNEEVIITTPTINYGEKVYWKGMGTRLSKQNQYTIFSSTSDYSIEGNIQSLISQTSTTLSTSTQSYIFSHLFSEENAQYHNLMNAADLILPFMTLSDNCYEFMFYGCHCLEWSPDLPATTLAQQCYQYMFADCTGLGYPPELPATILKNLCYNRMFDYCTNLGMAPELPATIMMPGCYQYMFSYCYSLTKAPELPAVTLANSCYRGMFYYCQNLVAAPELLASVLVQDCYKSMFEQCNHLNYIKALFTSTDTTYTNNWVLNVASTGTFIKNNDASIAIGNSGIPIGWSIKTEVEEIEEIVDTYTSEYFTLEARENNTSFTLSIPAAITTDNLTSISYSLDNGSTWTTTNNSSSAVTITTPDVSKGDKVLWKGSGTNMGISSAYSSFTATGKFNVEGNIMSLLYDDNFEDKTSMTVAYGFTCLFMSNNKIVSARKLVLPVKNPPRYCYGSMFKGSSIVHAPAVIDITTPTGDHTCYQMFQNCASLITPPTLPSTSITGQGVYQVMFEGCSSLQNAPYLPATNIPYQGYQVMFRYCTKLVNVQKVLPATTFNANNVYYGMFYGCSSLEVAPELPALTLTNNCYGWMFGGCSKLKYIKAMFTTTPSDTYTQEWVNGVPTTSDRIFVKNAEAQWDVRGTNGIPKNWTVQTATE